jgi:hypothetical protein
MRLEWHDTPEAMRGMRLDSPEFEAAVEAWISDNARDGLACVFLNLHGRSLFRRVADREEKPPSCPYCGRTSERTTGDLIYRGRPDLSDKTFFRCAPCDAYVGCDARGRPLGTLADRDLRRARADAHQTFDPLWRSEGMSRSDAYAWLASELGVAKDECHIGMFDEDRCQRTVIACLARKRKGTDRKAPRRATGWTRGTRAACPSDGVDSSVGIRHSPLMTSKGRDE